MSAAQSRPLRGTLISAGVLPSLYLISTIWTIAELASSRVMYLHWYGADIATLPMSALAEMFLPDRLLPPVVLYPILAVLNAGVIYLACYVALRLWARMRTAGWRLESSRRNSIVLIVSAYAVRKIKGLIVYPVNGMAGPIMAVPLEMLMMTLTIGLAVAAIRLWPSGAQEGTG